MTDTTPQAAPDVDKLAWLDEAGPLRAYQFAANEWADIATNGTQYLRNVRDGICTPDEAIANMCRDVAYCQGVSARARKVCDAAAKLQAATPARDEQNVTVRYDLSPANTEGDIRDKLIELGWTPPQATPAEPAQAVELHDERGKFETWADGQGFPLELTVHGNEYQDLRTQGPWEAWQARAALSGKPSA